MLFELRRAKVYSELMATHHNHLPLFLPAGQPAKPVRVQGEDFTQLEVTWREGIRIEVHMQAAPQEAVQQRPVVGGGMRVHPDAQPMSVLIVMVDSVAHNQFQRRAGRIYRFLEEDPNTVILQGQTVVGKR